MKLKPNPDRLTPPGNESSEHFLLKQISKIFLKAKFGCKYIGSEVYMGISIDRTKKNIKPYNEKKITDAVGIEERPLPDGSGNFIVRNIETKVSVADYKSGYNVMGDYNYLIIPEGMLDDEDVPSHMGIIEVDLDNYNIFQVPRAGIILEGVEFTSYPKQFTDKKYIAGSHDKYVDFVKDKMLKTKTNQDIYKNMWVYW